ncbi:hypothetical protein [Neoaquamicrobium sediminum]|uniref:hypothetical protein n=1 Tax=Neoaquamicrobium sediminum TaxID=1849104 RepID=UPI001565C8C5|nr:hypothetical protein [Mesorhizobium sediminum]NRC54903.1 hypothetical protein [Mesorhizobium sediminum]
MSLNRILLSGLSALAIVTGTVLGAANAQDAAPQTPPPAEAAPQQKHLPLPHLRWTRRS